MGTHAPSDPLSGLAAFLRGLVIAVCCAIVLGLHVRTFVVQAFVVVSPSMTDTLWIGDHVVVDKLSFSAVGVGLPGGAVRRGDLVLIDRRYAHDTKNVIKRCVATAGETVEIIGTTLYVDDVAIDDWVRGQPGGGSFPRSRVPADHLFVLGDNRAESRDSRDWGFVPVDAVRGRPRLVYLSLASTRPDTLDDWSKIPNRSFTSRWSGRIRWHRMLRVVN
ncbi:MAG: signal peptidase I [Acidobacteriota bacterium]